MRSHPAKHSWSRLVAVVVRGVDRSQSGRAPLGFSARVVALAFGRAPTFLDLAGVYAGRAVAIAWLLAVCGVLVNCEQIAELLVSGGA